MEQRLFEVEDHFYVQGRGLILIGKTEKHLPNIKIGHSIVLVKPNGEKIETKIIGIEFFNPNPNFEYLPILVPNLTKSEVPIGTIVLSNEL